MSDPLTDPIDTLTAAGPSSTTVINGAPTTDKTSYTPGETLTLSMAGVTATVTTVTPRTLALTATLTATDGTGQPQTFTGTVTENVTTSETVPAKLTAVSLGGVAGTIAPDGLSATVVVP